MTGDEEIKPRGGWIKLYHLLQYNPLWLCEPFTPGQAWADLLLIANYRDGIIRRRGIKVSVKRGEVAWSYRALADRWKWSVGKVQRYMNELKSDKQIHFRTDTEKVSVTTLIVITNYEKYQSSDTETGTETDTETGTEEEVKEVKKESKPSSCPKPKKPVCADAVRLSGMLADMILKNNHKHTKLGGGDRASTVASWSQDVDKLIRLDGQDPDDIEKGIAWCQSDPFWKANILSGAALRKQWDRLRAKMIAQGGNRPAHQKQQASSVFDGVVMGD